MRTKLRCAWQWLGCEQLDMVSVKQFGHFLIYIFRRFEANENRKNAASLTFVTLFAIVPLMTVSYGLLKVFPEFSGVSEELHEFVFKHFAPASGDVIKNYLQGFSEQASKLTWIGIATLGFSAFTLLLTIENALNRVWRVAAKRSGVGRFLLYWTMMSLGPLLLGVGFVVSSYLISLPFWLEDKTAAGLIRVVPYAFSALALTLMYTIVPGCKVEFRHALVGGLVAALMLELGKKMFLQMVSSFPSYQLIYGAFAAIPLFLVWVYVAWCLVLLGAELVRALGYAKKVQRGVRATDLDWSLEILRQASLAQQQGKTLQRGQLMEHLPLANADDWEAMLALLVDEGWLVLAADGGYALIRDLHSSLLSDLSDLIHKKHIVRIGVDWKESVWYERLNPVFMHVLIEKKTALSIPIHQVLFPR